MNLSPVRRSLSALGFASLMALGFTMIAAHPLTIGGVVNVVALLR
jgi:hypothetical protein